jgi:hypothetical protein
MDEERRRDAAAEVALGLDALLAATTLLEAGLPNDAVSRAYYAAFHHARALLLLRGLEPKTHRGVISLLEKHFADAGLLSHAVVSAMARLETFRGIADYDTTQRLSQERARTEVDDARLVVDSCAVLLRAEGVSS